MRDLLNAGEPFLDRYLRVVLKLTKMSYATQSASVMLHASKLNSMWLRIFLESYSQRLTNIDVLSDIVRQVSEAYIQGNL